MQDLIRVLHVEDDLDFVEFAADYLETQYESLSIDTVTTGPTALEQLIAEPYDCVVSDYDLGGMNGVELLESIRVDFEDLPFILFTGKGGEDVATEAIRSGVTDYLQKTGGTEQLELLWNRIENAVEKHRVQTNYRNLFEKIDTGLVVHDPESGEILEANDAFGAFVGMEADELRGSHPGEISPPNTEFDRERASTLVQRAFEEGTQTFEWKLLHADGTEYWVEVKLTPTTFGGYERVLAFVHDVTERKTREDAIRNLHEVATDLATCSSREEVYRRTLEASERLLDFDRAAIAIERNDKLEVVAMSAAMPLDTPPTMETDEGIAGKTFQTGESFLINDISAEPTAVPQTEVTSAISVPIGDRGVFQVIEDDLAAFSERDRELAELLVRHTESALDLLDREEALSRQNDRLEEFVSFVSHDLRGPINVASGRLALAKEDTNSEHFDEIESSLQRMDELIDALLTLAREGESFDEHEWVELPEIVENCFETLDCEGATLGHVSQIRVRGDRGQLRQLIDNMLRNAIDHGGPDVTVEVGVREGDDGFYVADDGPGIPADKRELIFDRGFSTTDSGIGYGLKIVEQIAASHDWSISVKSSEADGARFDFHDLTLERLDSD